MMANEMRGFFKLKIRHVLEKGIKFGISVWMDDSSVLLTDNISMDSTDWNLLRLIGIIFLSRFIRFSKYGDLFWKDVEIDGMEEGFVEGLIVRIEDLFYEGFLFRIDSENLGNLTDFIGRNFLNKNRYK